MYFADWFGGWFSSWLGTPVDIDDGEPVTLAEAKANLRVTHAEEDEDIRAMIVVAREQAEHLTDRAVVRQTLVRQFGAFCYGGMELPRQPLVSVTSVQYVDPAGVMQTLAPSAYYIDDSQEIAQLLPAYGTVWPSTLNMRNAVRVTYLAGWTRAECPTSIKRWILLYVGSLYENRERDTDARVDSLGFVDRLLDRFTIWRA